MDGGQSDIVLWPIGRVSNGLVEPPTPRSLWDRVVSDLVIRADLTEALEGIEEFSHIIVLFWLHHQTQKEMPLRQRPRRHPGGPLKGLFALRSPNRPNPIGKTTVRLLRRQGNILTVEGLDALNGTPILDIKPYLPGYDAAPDASVPDWISS